MPEKKAASYPRAGVSVAVFRGNEVLLVQRGNQLYAGFWSLPGGEVQWGEKVAEAARRELEEETGLLALSSHFGGCCGRNRERQRGHGDGPLHDYCLCHLRCRRYARGGIRRRGSEIFRAGRKGESPMHAGAGEGNRERQTGLGEGRRMTFGAVRPALLAVIAVAAAAVISPASAQWWPFSQRQGGAHRYYRQTPQPSPPPKPTPPKPPPPDDRPYDLQIFRLAEIIGSLHYLRELCGANEGQVWREHMRELASSEGTSALRRAKLVESFNRGYRDYSRTYRTCTQPALLAIQRYMDQASAIADALIANDK